MLRCMVFVLAFVSSCLGRESRYLWGDALADDVTQAVGPDGDPYPSALIDELFQSGGFGGYTRSVSHSRSMFGSTLDPGTVSNILMKSQEAGDTRGRGRSLFPLPASSAQATARNMVSNDVNANLRVASPRSKGKAFENDTLVEEDSGFPESSSAGCPVNTPPAQLCPTKYNTTAPMWGTSLTSGKKVTIVQKFPDLLQQVIFHECKSEQCDFIHGRCTQTYTPYLFLVIPLGPVTLTGQDYVMVESGCACQPKYSSGSPYDTPLDAFLG